MVSSPPSAASPTSCSATTDGAFLDGVGLTSFPRTYFVDATGTIVGEVGELDADELRGSDRGELLLDGTVVPARSRGRRQPVRVHPVADLPHVLPRHAGQVPGTQRATIRRALW
jgi:hypothetical protein